MKFGVNTWVWTAPLTTEELEELVPHVAGMGFDWIEFPLEEIGGFDAARAAELVKEHGLGVSTCVAMGPDRDLIHPDPHVRKNGAAASPEQPPEQHRAAQGFQRLAPKFSEALFIATRFPFPC